MNTWTQVSLKSTPSSRAAFAAHSHCLGVNQNVLPIASPPAVPQTAIASLRAISSNESLPPPRLLPLRSASAALQPPLLRVGRQRFGPGVSRHWSHPFGSSRRTVTRIVTRRYLKDKFTASFLDSCFDFPDSKFFLILLPFDPVLSLIFQNMIIPDQLKLRSS